MEKNSISKKPYLIRAIYDWCVDNNFTPHLSVVVTPETIVPNDFVKKGQIILNVSPLATHKLKITNFEISFVGRFSGKPTDVLIPIENVLSIYAKEVGEGLTLETQNKKPDVKSNDFDKKFLNLISSNNKENIINKKNKKNLKENKKKKNFLKLIK